jgi:uncharacterized membrane protein YeaQ/YmgE (transglycosylase-associated protein family)
MITGIIGLLLIGLIAGALARLLVPGRDPMGIGATILLGIVGSFIGGTLGALIFGGEFTFARAESLIGAVVGSIIALLVYRRVATAR